MAKQNVKWWEVITGLAIPKKIAESTNKSWVGIILNPVGYALSRESLSNASERYYKLNHISLNDITSVEDYERKKAQWVDGCAAQLKSEDPGKSLANASVSCEERWNNDPGVIEFSGVVNEMQAVADQEAKEQTERLIRLVIFIVIAFVALYFLLKII